MKHLQIHGAAMSLRAIPLLLLLAAAAAQADEPVGDQTGIKLAQKYNCLQCHTIDRAHGGPSFSAIAKKYASDPNARDEISASILNGSSGVWGPLPMPPVDVSKEDLRPLVDWILSLNHT
jgi:cytochrome c